MKRALRDTIFFGMLLASWLIPVGAQGPSLEAQLARAEAKWSANKPKAYEFALEILCFCAPLPPGSEPIVFRVRDGSGSLRTGSRAASLRTRNPEDLEKYSTVKNQFMFIRQALKGQPFRAEIEYDPILGYPRRVYIDPQESVVDEEYGFAVKAFKAAPQ